MPDPRLPLAVLLLEDQPDDAELLLLELRRAGFEPISRRVETEADYLAALEAGYAPGQPWDLVLADYQLPSFSGVRALALLQEHGSDLPFILVSGTIGEDVAVQSIQAGASDYLLKGRLARLKHAVTHALEDNRLRLEKRAAERAGRASEQRLRALIENSADGIGVVGADGRLSYLSPAVQRVLGFAPQDLLGQNPFEYVHPDDLSSVKAVVRAVQSNPGASSEAEYRLRHADGSWRLIHTTVTNLLAEPSVAGVVFNYRDVTERRAGEEALRASEERYRRLFDGNPLPMLVYDAATRAFLAVNDAALLHYGYSRAEFLSMTIRDLHPLDEVPPLEQHLGRSRPAQDRSGPWRHRLKDGRLIRVEIISHDIHFDGRPARLVLVNDITDQLTAQQALRASEARYRGLFDNSPVALWEEDFSRVKQRLDALPAPDRQNIDAYLRAHPEFVAECVRLLTMLHLNASTLKMYGAVNGVELEAAFAHIVDPQVNVGFAACLANVARGQTDFELESVERNLAGQDMYVSLRWSALPGHERSLDRVIVSALNITERVRAEAELKLRLAELEAVNRISASLRAARSLDEMLPVLVQEAVGILAGTGGGIWLYDPATDQLRVAHALNWTVAPKPERPGESLAGKVFASGQPYLARELRGDPALPPDLRESLPPGRCAAALPIRAGGEPIGVLIVTADLPQGFTLADTHLLGTLADMAGNAIQRTRLHEQTERQLSRMVALRLVDQAISSSLDLRVTLNVLLDQAISQLAADAADVLLLNPHRQILEYFAGRGHRGASAERVRLRLGEGRAGRAAYDRRLVQVDDLRVERGLDPAAALVAAEGYVAYHAVPLLAKGQIKGVLEVYHRRPIETRRDWLDFLEALAGQATIAVDNAALFEGLQRSNLELTLAYDATIAGWSRALDLRDRETEGHTQRATDLAVRLAAAVFIPEAEIIHVRRGALLHDIGNMGVPTNLLLKPGPLTDDEWAVVRQHPQYAFELLSPIAFLRKALDIPYGHHEKWDGTGYPHGLKGEAIPLAARVFAVVDVWDSLLSERPYRPAWPREQALAYLREQSGRHFDPRVLAAFLRLLDERAA